MNMNLKTTYAISSINKLICGEASGTKSRLIPYSRITEYNLNNKSHHTSRPASFTSYSGIGRRVSTP